MRCSRVITAILLCAVFSGSIPSMHGESLASQAGTNRAGKPQTAATQAGKPQTAVSQAGKPQTAASQAGKPQAAAFQTGKLQAAASQTGTAQFTEFRTYPDTVRWFTATYAVWSVRNGADLYTPGGGTPDEAFYALVIKSVMERDWGIRDRQSAQSMISWLEKEGHNQALLKYYEEHDLGQYGTDIDLNASWDSGQGESSDGEAARQMAAYMGYRTYGAYAASGWDYSRALMLLGQCYVAGYYTYEEAMDKSLELGKKLQSMFPSWEDFMQSYMYGFVYWSRSDPTEPQSEFQYRVSIYHYLDSLEDGPFKMDWNMELKKEW